MLLEAVRIKIHCLQCKEVHIIGFIKCNVYISAPRICLLLCLWIHGASIPSSVILAYSYMMFCGGIVQFDFFEGFYYMLHS